MSLCGDAGGVGAAKLNCGAPFWVENPFNPGQSMDHDLNHRLLRLKILGE